MLNTFHKLYNTQDNVSETEPSTVGGKFRASCPGSLPLNKIKIAHILSSIPLGLSTYFHGTYCHHSARVQRRHVHL